MDTRRPEEIPELPEIPDYLKRSPGIVAEPLPDTPIEIERVFVSIEEEGGKEVKGA